MDNKEISLSLNIFFEYKVYISIIVVEGCYMELTVFAQPEGVDGLHDCGLLVLFLSYLPLEAPRSGCGQYHVDAHISPSKGQ